MAGFYDELYTAPDTLKYFVKGEWKVSKSGKTVRRLLDGGLCLQFADLEGQLINQSVNRTCCLMPLCSLNTTWTCPTGVKLEPVNQRARIQSARHALVDLR